MLLGMFLFLALAVFIVWDSRRLRNEKSKPITRKVMARGFLPKGIVPWHLYLGFGSLHALLAYVEWEQPSTPPFTGRWSWLHQVLFEFLGARGMFIWWMLLAGMFLALGIALACRDRP